MSLKSATTGDVQISVDPCDFGHQFVDLLKTLLPKLESFDSVDSWEHHASKVRTQMLELFSSGHPSGLFDEPPKVAWHETIHTDQGYHIRKLAYEGYPGMWIPALLYVPNSLTDGAPVVLNPNGHHTGGKAMAYKQARCINLAKRGIIALNTEFIGMGQLTGSIPHSRLAYLDGFGVSGAGLFYLAVKRGLDVLLGVDGVDRGRVGVTGLSGGGWQTLILSALDTRISVSAPVAGYSPIWQRIEEICDIGDNEQIPPDFCTVTDYDSLTAMIAPRPLLLIYNRYDDCCFQSGRTRASVYERALPIYELYEAPDGIEFYENLEPGTHNYERDSRSRLYRFLNAQFGLDTDENDLPFAAELMTESALSVELPPDNATILSVALDLVARRRSHGQSKVSDSIELLRIPDARIDQFESFGRTARKERFIERGVLRLDGTFDVPVVRLDSDMSPQPGPHLSGLVLNDAGRLERTPTIPSAVHSWDVAVFADVFGTGERYIIPQYEMVWSASGNRMLGVQVAQIVALLEWLDEKGSGVSVCAKGRTVSVAALFAACRAPERFARLEVEQLPRSFSDLVEQVVPYDEAPALFCRGLLEGADIEKILDSCEVAVFDSARGPLTARALEILAGSD